MVRQFRATRIADVVNKRIRSPYRKNEWPIAPAWFKAVEAIPPAEILTRTIPVAHQAPNPHMHKPRQTYRPQKITYEEDGLRKTFFRDHPWELARPRVILETDGKDAQRYDWSKGIMQPGLPLCGECVVQRQMYLMHASGLTKDQAYDAARREFYKLRHQEEVEKRVAQEEARMVGAYFDKSPLQIGMELEDKEYEGWKAWATEETAKFEALRSKAYISFGKDAESGAGAGGGAAGLE
ncbi:mitochondrial ribosomal small subunit component [Sporothrix curviconia]|uniref:37S ribosomal protein S25, mitochondrial n=1 Tax=Sporothrix curviconia TaxID=1260050 RepID=A0ABP0BIG4_9PEZI